MAATARRENTSSSPAIAERVRSVVRDLSYREAADIMGTTHETIRRMMNGHAVTVTTLVAFCEAFEVSAEWLLFGAGRKRAKRAPAGRRRD